MRFWKGILMAVALVTFATTAWAQPTQPAIGVFFDDQASSIWADFPGGVTQFHTAYVFAVNLDQMVGGMAFKLDMDPAIHVMGSEYPEAVNMGEPKDGVGIGFQDCKSAYDGEPVLGCVMTLWTGNSLLANAEIRVVAHPGESGIMISDCDGNLTPVSGLTSFLSVTVDNESTSWGAVKTLYK